MKAVFIVPVVLALAVCSAVAQDSPQQETKERKATIDARSFEQTLLKPKIFAAAIKELLNSQEFEGFLFQVVELSHSIDKEFRFPIGIVNEGEFVSFDLTDGAFVFRIMTADQKQELASVAADELPADLKAKQFFEVVKVTPDLIRIKKGETSVTVPTSRILYFQRGRQPLFKK